ncbi:MAG: hypothetical protein GEEBNDBF_01153 [bacterium]|nr:hypothetical protein [bacterium]
MFMPQTLPVGHTAGQTHLTADAIRGAIRVAFGNVGAPPVVRLVLHRQGASWRAEVTFDQGDWSPEHRRTWVINEYFARWNELEHQLAIRLHLRRRWS